jgi:hypothetical protein
VDQLIADDTVASDLREQVITSHRDAETFVGRVANTEAEAFLALIDEFESPALRFLAGLADAGLQAVAVGTWIPKYGSVCFEAQLTSMYKNWDRMKANLGNAFVGTDNTWPDRGWEKGNTSDAFENLFIRVALQSSAALVAGLSQPDMQSILANRIGEGEGADPNTYDSGNKELAVFLVGDYDPEKDTSEGLGFLLTNYRIQVKDYRKKRKNDPDPKTLITGRSRACLFTDLATISSHASAAGNPLDPNDPCVRGNQ